MKKSELKQLIRECLTEVKQGLKIIREDSENTNVAVDIFLRRKGNISTEKKQLYDKIVSANIGSVKEYGDSLSNKSSVLELTVQGKMLDIETKIQKLIGSTYTISTYEV